VNGPPGPDDERALERAAQNEQALRNYVQQAATSSPSTSDELAKLADLRDRGAISHQEFAHAKASLLGTQAAGTADSGSDQKVSAG
jgi:multidrug resistance efflux pump